MNKMNNGDKDILTGIYSREGFCVKVKEILAQNPEADYVVAAWDIEKFKVINELYGTIIGDRILISFAEKLDKLCKESDGIAARLESDHFVICVPNQHVNSIRAYAEEIMITGISLDDVIYPVVVHIGMYMVDDHDVPVSAMCDRANLALDTVKGKYNTRWAYYDKSLTQELLNEQEIINQMQNALNNHEFYIVIQPIVDAITRKVVAGEALVRWKHPQKGIISPGVFIPVFEKNGFIANLDMFVCREVCKYLAQNNAAGVENVPISVNISRINFYNPNLGENILDITKEFNIDPGLIKIEITESAYNDNTYDLLTAMSEFKQIGFQVLMDDFGSGYSSLNMLKDVPVDVLKIDMKFMEDLDSSERACNILFSIIQMAKRLRMGIVAEGVETKNQYDMLKSMGCDSIQGYYFSRPLETDKYTEKLLEPVDNSFSFDKELNEDRPGILVVDDNEMSRKIIASSINDRYRIMEACNGREALDFIRNNFATIDLVISDIVMPEMDGLTLLRNIKNSEIFGSIPVLVVTSTDANENRIKALDIGALDVIDKPIEPILLRNRVRNIFNAVSGQQNHGYYKLVKDNVLLKQKLDMLTESNTLSMCRLLIGGEGSVKKVTDIQYCNDTYLDIHNLTIDQLKSDVNSIFSIITENYDNCYATVHNAITGKEPKAQIKYKTTTKDGTIKDVVCDMAFTYWDNNQIAIDICEIIVE